MGDRVEKASLLLVVINGIVLLGLGAALAFLFTKELTHGQGYGPDRIPVPGYGKATVTLPLIQRAIGELDAKEREEILGDKTLFQRFVHDRTVHRATLMAARDDEEIRKDPVLDYRMQRAAEQVLVDGYLKRKLDAGVPKNYPSEEQMRAFHKQYKDRFTVGEKIHAWQIFLTLPRDASDKEYRKVMRTARDLARKLKAGKIHFSDAAIRYSEHEPSRAGGGYLGIFDVSQLFPIPRKALTSLDEGKIGDPVRSDTGVHLFKRGAKIPARTLPFDEVREKIRAEMRRTTLDDLRESVSRDAHESHGEPVPESVAEEWRMRLGKDGFGLESGMEALESRIRRR